MGYGPSGFGTLRCSSAADGRKRSLGTPYCSPSLVSASCTSFTSGGVCTCRSNYTGLKCSACDSGYLFDPHPYCKSGACRTTVWSAWSACSVTCGSAAAARFRTRSVRFVSLCVRLTRGTFSCPGRTLALQLPDSRNRGHLSKS